MSRRRYSAVIVAFDGVVMDTSSSFERARQETFEQVVRSGDGGVTLPAASRRDRPAGRRDARSPLHELRAFLDQHEIRLPLGTPEDQPGTATVHALANRIRERYRELVEREASAPNADALTFLTERRAEGCGIAAISWNVDCRWIAERFGANSVIDTIVDGTAFDQLRLTGAPEPDAIEVAMANLGVDPAETILVDSTVAGVHAGRLADAGLCVGVSNRDPAHALSNAGADVVVPRLSRLSAERLTRWFREGQSRADWKIAWFDFQPEHERLREALTTVGNGYLGTRGAHPWEDAADDVHYPGTYIMGLFNRRESRIHGQRITNTDFVNCPNWTRVGVRIEEGGLLHLKQVETLAVAHTLHLDQAVCEREIRFRDDAGRITRFTERRFVAMHRMNLVAQECTVTPENWSGRLAIVLAIDGTVVNYGVERYRRLAREHIEPERSNERPDGLMLAVRTTTSRIEVLMEQRARLAADTLYPEDPVHRVDDADGLVSQRFTFFAREGCRYRVERFVGVATSRDLSEEQPADRARAGVQEALAEDPSDTEIQLASVPTDGIFERQLALHGEAWQRLWRDAAIEIEGDRFARHTLRLHVHHLLATASPNNPRIDAGMPARGLHGEAYRGHFFWDEIFTLPWYNLVFPEVTRACLLYRYRRLDAAREAAHRAGYRGAMFPWQSAETGEEESQQIHYNPRSGEWDPDLSRHQRHISTAIATLVLWYVRDSGDTRFLAQYGMEMLLEVGRFWASRAEYDESDGRYHISGVMGPDEFHERYPDSDEAGFRDNAYTNITAAWLLRRIEEEWTRLSDATRRSIARRVRVDAQEFERWRAVRSGLALEIGEDGVISQFSGWRDLAEIDWERYRRRYDSVRRMDRILRAENDSANRYQVTKQADTLMTFYLMTPDEAVETIRGMGYDVPDGPELLRINYDHYIDRTSHGSTLSYIVHARLAWMLAGRRAEARRLYREALRSDRFDTQGGTTPEGIHCGVMAGTALIAIHSYAGLSLTTERLSFDPVLPPRWTRIAFRMAWRGRRIAVEIGDGRLALAPVAADDEPFPTVPVRVQGEDYELDRAGLSITLVDSAPVE